MKKVNFNEEVEIKEFPREEKRDKTCIASGIGFVTGLSLGITIAMLVPLLPFFFLFTLVSALVGTIIGYGAATFYEKKTAEINTYTTTLKNVSTSECFQGNNNELKANII